MTTLQPPGGMEGYSTLSFINIGTITSISPMFAVLQRDRETVETG